MSQFINKETIDLAPNIYEYELSSMVFHHGTSLKGGHYTTLSKNMADNTWRHFNDDQKPAIKSDIRSFIDKIQATPYVLFFKRLNKKSK